MLGQTRGTCPVCTSSHRWNVIISLHSWPANPAYILRIAPHAGPGYIWLPWGGPELPVRAGKAQHSHAHCSPGCGCPAGLRSRWAAGATGAPSRVRAARPMFCVPLVPARAVACVRACVSACAHVCGVCACVWTRARLLTPSPKVPALLCACPPCRRPAHVAWAPPWPWRACSRACLCATGWVLAGALPKACWSQGKHKQAPVHGPACAPQGGCRWSAGQRRARLYVRPRVYCVCQCLSMYVHAHAVSLCVCMFASVCAPSSPCTMLP